MRNGFSTGTCAAAASKAAMLSLLGQNSIVQVEIILPDGSQAVIPVQKTSRGSQVATAEVIKDGGDDPDVTHGMSIISRVEWWDEPGIVVKGGKGIGIVTKPGLAVEVGEPAINPVPCQMIRAALANLLPAGMGIQVTISAPQGEKVALKTMNARLGIMGGISILGTSGLVRPMSQEAYIDSLVPQVHQARALGHEILVLTPGGMGARMAAEKGINPDAIIQTSNYIGALLQESARSGARGIVLFGHIGKMIKVAAGIFNTHSKIADARRETLAAYAALRGAKLDVIKEIMELNTIDAARGLLEDNGLNEVYIDLAAAATRRCSSWLGETLMIGTVTYALNGEILGYDAPAGQLGRQLGWNI